jgi:phage-related protein
MRQIIFYRTESGRCPVEVFLDSLTSKQAQKAVWVLRLIEELDIVPNQYFKKLVNAGDIWEVRVQVSGNIFRLLGFFDGGILLILTNGFAKKTQKIPAHEIALAVDRKRDYFERRRPDE